MRLRESSHPIRTGCPFIEYGTGCERPVRFLRDRIFRREGFVNCNVPFREPVENLDYVASGVRIYAGK